MAAATETTGTQSGDVRAAGAGNGGGAGMGLGSGVGNGTGTGTGDGTEQRARCVYCPEPDYPLIARRRGWEGSVDVGLSLRPDGGVEHAGVRRSSGHEVLDREALEVARRSRFMADDPAAQLLIEYRFELSSR